MRRSSLVLGLFCTLGVWLHPDLEAQARGPEAAFTSLGLHAGAVAPQTTLPDGSSHSSGAVFGAVGSVWPLDFVGVRVSVAYGKTEGVEGEVFSAAAAHDPRVWLYSAEVALRYPFASNRIVWFPYLSAGPGGKSYRWAIERPRIGDSALAWSYGGGIDIRPAATGRVGIVLDLRNYRSRYMWHGLGVRATVPEYKAYGPMLNDVLFTAGITFNR
jgi:hypothetical protein